MLVYARRCLIWAHALNITWAQIFSCFGRMFRAAEGKWFKTGHWFMAGKKELSCLSGMLLPSLIVFRRSCSVLSSWAITGPWQRSCSCAATLSSQEHLCSCTRKASCVFCFVAFALLPAPYPSHQHLWCVVTAAVSYRMLLLMIFGLGLY